MICYVDKKYYSEKNRNLSIIKKTHSKCDVIDGSVVNVSRQPLIFSFLINKPSGYKLFCEPETINYTKRNKSVLNTITFYPEEDNLEEVDFNGETLTFTIQIVKI